MSYSIFTIVFLCSQCSNCSVKTLKNFCFGDEEKLYVIILKVFKPFTCYVLLYVRNHSWRIWGYILALSFILHCIYLLQPAFYTDCRINTDSCIVHHQHCSSLLHNNPVIAVAHVFMSIVLRLHVISNLLLFLFEFLLLSHRGKYKPYRPAMKLQTYNAEKCLSEWQEQYINSQYLSLFIGHKNRNLQWYNPLYCDSYSMITANIRGNYYI